MLERFKKSALQDADPDIRTKALLELDADDPAFADALTGDADDGVRARLMAHVTSVATLDARRREESSPRVREAAVARLRQVLTDDALCDDAAQAAYLAGCDDADLVGHLALHASSVDRRRDALARHQALSTEAESHQLLQLAVASRDADSDLQQAAQSAIDDLDILEALVQRTRKSDKVSHRFARERQKALRDAAMAEDKLKALREDIEQRAEQTVEANGDAVHQAVARQQQWEQRFAAAAADAEAPDLSALIERVNASIDAARKAVSEREAIIEHVQAREGALDEASLRERWSALPDPSPRETELFEQGLIAWVTLEKRMAAAGSAWEAASALLESAEADGATTTLKSFENAWAALKLGDPADDEQRALVERHAARVAALTEVAKREEAARERAVAQAEALLEKLRSALEEGQISAATSACDRLTHRLRKKDNLGGAPLARLEKGLAELSPRLAELKQARIWSTQQARQELIAEVEALALQADDTSPKALATRIRALRGKWRELDHGIGPAHQDIWTRFDTACKTAYAPAKEHFGKEAKQRGENKTRRVGICESLETLAAETDWESPDFKAVEKALSSARRAWREAGPVNHRDMKPLRKRYDDAQDAVEKHLAPERERELRRRQLAIKSLENSIENDPLPKQIDLAKRIQRDWAPTVRGRRREEQKLWDTLRKLCDSVFEQRNAETKSRRAAQDESVAAREAILDELAELKKTAKPSADDDASKALNAAYSGLKDRWREAGDVHPKKRTALQKRYRDLCKAIDGVQKDARRQAGARKDQAVVEVLQAIDERWRALASGASADAVDAAGVTGPLGKLLASAAEAQPPTGKGGERAALCLESELDADVDSPPECAADRMKLKVERLNAAMAGASQLPPRERVAQRVEQWLRTPLAGDSSDAETWSRFR
ncbi:MAG: DUF349 domain-containing protein, partial [Pseudomonadota bacterium]